MFSMRIFTINYYMINPEPEYDQTYSNFRRFEIKQVPVLRIFGSTPDGRKSCLHVHNVFPYLLIRNFKSEEQLDRFLYDLSENIDKTLNTTIAQRDGAHIQHVYKIEVVRAKSMYGYHEKENTFLKIYLYNPDLIRRLSDLLVNGVIMNEVFQPFNSHIPYNLQFLIDYNLFGMNFIHLDGVKYRKMNKQLFYEQDEYFEPRFKDRSDDISQDLFLDETRFPRQSLCELEVDCCASAILNPNLQKDDIMLNPGLSALWNDERKRRKTLNLDENITPPESQERDNILTVETEVALKKRLIELLEERFDSKYPFKKETDKSMFDTTNLNKMLSNSQFDEIDDENIINILDSLHNETTNNEILENEECNDEDIDADYDSALVQATQLDDEEKLKLLEENKEMTQKMELGDQNEKINDGIEYENENHDILNNSTVSSGSDECDDEVVREDNEEEDDDEDESVNVRNETNNEKLAADCNNTDVGADCEAILLGKNTVQLQNTTNIGHNSTIVWSDFDIDSQELSINKSKIEPASVEKPNKIVKRKYKGVKRMVVKIDRIDPKKFSNKCFETVNSHYCHYFATRGQLKECSHVDNHISQHSCLNCDHGKEQMDSLAHMAFYSPSKTTPNIIDKPVFSSPSVIKVPVDDDVENDEDSNDTTTLKNENVDNDNTDDDDATLVEALDDTINHSDSSLSDNENSNSSKNTDTSISLSSDSDDDDDLQKKFLKLEKEKMKRKNMIDKLCQNITETNNKIENLFIEEKVDVNDGTWFCPVQTIASDLNTNAKPTANDSIICYSTGNSKKWKLNVDEIETKYKTKRKLEIEENPTKTFWFTPAIPFPSFDRKYNIQKAKLNRRKKLQKIHSEVSQFDKCSIISSNESLTSTLTQIESDYSQFIASVPPSLAPTNSNTGSVDDEEQKKLSILQTPKVNANKSDAKLNCTESLVRSKKKSVRFNENDEDKPTCSKYDADLKIDESSNDSSNLSSVSQPVHDKTIDYSEVSICDETIQNESAYLDSSKMSFYEYNSMLVPKCTKFIDSLICTQDLTTTIVEPKLPSTQQKNDFKHKTEPTNLATTEADNLTLLSMEVYVNTRENLQPNPEFDTIGFICYSIYTEKSTKGYASHIIMFDKDHRSLATKRFICTLSGKYFKSIDYAYKEEDLIMKFVKVIQFYDPDILLGFEIQKLSWCFLVKRALKLGIKDICPLMSRLPKFTRESVLRGAVAKNKKPTDGEVFMLPQDLQISGRIILNLWRVLRAEISLNIYTFENCCYHIMHERTPKYSFGFLTSLFQHRTDLLRWKVFSYYVHRTETNLRMIEKLNLISKTSEFSRVYGIEFYHVLSRGSQYRVESMMLRIAKKLNYIPVSPSVQQKAKMRAPECIPLTLEPESKFYTNPLAILDFQSLYPSVIIGFNICFTTCLGRVESIGKDGCFKFGCTSLFISDDLIKSLDFDKDVYFAPSGVAFVKSHIRKGVLPIMLEDILKTRVMVKNSMKLYKNDQNLLDVLDTRQLSLKLIANVTFGYTAANFSGRMPCTEIGDTIVRQARQILENSIKFIHSNYHKYGGRVVYGDTDSMFILFENLSKTKAFDVSMKIVNDISNMYKKPIKLKFEKIYYPSVLVSKKRYVGYSYESVQQVDPVLDAKGIEVVRRDGCQIASKILERCLKILFEFKDPDKVKYYLQRQCSKIVQGKVNIKDFIIAKEYRGRGTYQNVKSIAACQIANKNLITDPLAEPLTGERVPYLIAYGPPGLPLYELVRAPDDFLANDELKINYEYYIIKQILPPIDRVMSLMGINVFDWISHMSFKPKMFHKFAGTNYPNANANKAPALSIGKGLTTLTKFLVTTDCMLCGTKCDVNPQLPQHQRVKQGLCTNCSKLDQQMIIKLKLKSQKYEKQYSQLLKVCKACTSNIEYGNFNRKLDCSSLDCPNMFLCSTTQQHLDKYDYLRSIIDEYF